VARSAPSFMVKAAADWLLPTSTCFLPFPRPVTLSPDPIPCMWLGSGTPARSGGTHPSIPRCGVSRGPILKLLCMNETANTLYAVPEAVSTPSTLPTPTIFPS
jgi:hypothetical protein